MNSFKNYKEAKHILPHLEGILKIVDLSMRSLKLFDCYLPVIRILKVLKEEQSLLQIHQKKYEDIIKTKGKL